MKKITNPFTWAKDHLKIDDDEYRNRIYALLDKAERLHQQRVERGLVYKRTWRSGYTERRVRHIEGHYVLVAMRPETKPRRKPATPPRARARVGTPRLRVINGGGMP